MVEKVKKKDPVKVKKKDPVAVALANRRMTTMSAEERSEVARTAAKARWGDRKKKK
jgi:hypothetical protein